MSQKQAGINAHHSLPLYRQWQALDKFPIQIYDLSLLICFMVVLVTALCLAFYIHHRKHTGTDIAVMCPHMPVYT